MIRIEGIKLPFNKPEANLPEIISEALNISLSDIQNLKTSKKAVDARKTKRIFFVYSVDFETQISTDLLLKHSLPQGWHLKEFEPFKFKIKKYKTSSAHHQPVIVGSGPCGLFCGLALAEAGLNPILIERGKPVDQRIDDMNRFMETGQLNTESNIQFGEGGAGTFSDGKLYTQINDPRTQYIFDQLILAGAPPEIISDARPHIGTDKLQQVVSVLKEKIIQLGGDVRFETKFTNCTIENEQIHDIEINAQEKLQTNALVLAIGHSARDTVEMLFELGIQMAAKGFSIGVRIEHLQEWIQKAQYGNFCNDHRLPSARYKMAVRLPEDRGAYTFCMCPGGYVVPAASEAGGVVTNGMSLYAQDGVNANSALLVNVTPDDFGSSHPLAGIAYQREWEQKAFQAGGGDFTAPVQLLGDFLKDQISHKYRSVFPTYLPDAQFADLRDCLPDFVIRNIKAAIPLLNNKVNGFSHPDAILTGVETRSSSPVRILRNETLQSNIRGIYPAGEGSGYAGGIMSAAIDGLRIAEQILTNR